MLMQSWTINVSCSQPSSSVKGRQTVQVTLKIGRESFFDPKSAAIGKIDTNFIRPMQTGSQLRNVAENRTPLWPGHIHVCEVVVVGNSLLEDGLKQAERVLVNETCAGNPVGIAVRTGDELKVLRAGTPGSVSVEPEVEGDCHAYQNAPNRRGVPGSKLKMPQELAKKLADTVAKRPLP
jgi:hypothetical protein